MSPQMSFQKLAVLVVLPALLLAISGCKSESVAPEVLPTREAEAVPPEMLHRALKSLHSSEAKEQLSGLRFLKSFPEVKQQHRERIEQLANDAKDNAVKKLAAELLK